MKKSARHAADRMISGKKRKRAIHPRAVSGRATVDDTAYTWSQRHDYAVWERTVRVRSFSVWLDPGRTRELVLDVAFATTAEDSLPSADEVAAALEAGIRGARAAGWDPESRGRAFRYGLEVG